jgi:siroheme decarboxylase
MNLDINQMRLLNEFQRDFPLEPRPFRHIAEGLGMTEDEVIDVLRHLSEAGAISRIGAVVRPNSVGASTLAAMQVPEDRLDEVADLISARPEVNHNYQRDHAINLWFVVATDSREAVTRVLEDIEAATGITVLDLPLVTPFHIDLGFDLRC